MSSVVISDVRPRGDGVGRRMRILVNARGLAVRVVAADYDRLSRHT